MTGHNLLHLFQSPDEINSNIRNQLAIENDLQNIDEHDGDQDAHLLDDNNQREESSDGEKNDVPKDEYFVGIKNRLSEKNRQKPFTLVDLFQKNENYENVETPLIAIEDFDWFEPALKEIEQKYEKRKKQLFLSLDLDRKSNSMTVPLRVNEMLEKVLEDEMNSEIKLKYGKMKFERAKSSENNSRDKISVETVCEKKHEFSRNKYGISTENYEKGKARLSVSPASNFLVTDSEQGSLLKTKMFSVKRDIQQNRIKGRYRPGDHKDWKKLQEIRTHVKEETSDGVVDEDEVERKFLEWKNFIFTQEIAFEEIREKQRKELVTGDRGEIRGKNVEHENFQGENLNISTSWSNDERTIAKERNSTGGFKHYSQAQDRKLFFNNAVKDINRSSLKALEKLLAKRGENMEMVALEKTISDLKESLKAVDFVDIKMDEEMELDNKREENDVSIDFTDIFPIQAAKLKNKNEFKAEENRRFFDHKVEYSREQDFSEVEDLMREDIMSSISNNGTESREKTLSSSPCPSFFMKQIVDETDVAKSFGKAAREPALILEKKNDPQQPPNTPFFNGMEDLKNISAASGKYYVEEKSDGIVGSDINMPAEERNTTLLGTFDEQRMQNFYRTAKATTEEEQAEARNNYENFQRLQQKKMQQLGSMDLKALHPETNDFIKNGNVNMEKMLSIIEANRKLLVDGEMTEKSEVGMKERNDRKDVVDESHNLESEPNNVSNFARKWKERARDKTKIESQRNNLKFREGSDINLPPEMRSTVLLGTFDQQKMSNLYRQSGIENEEEKKVFDRKYKELLLRQEEGMKNLDTGDDGCHDIKALVNDDGELDTQKVLSWIDEKRKNVEEFAKVEKAREKPEAGDGNPKNCDEISTLYALNKKSSSQERQVIRNRKSDPESIEIANINTNGKFDIYSSNHINDLDILKSDSLSDCYDIYKETVHEEKEQFHGQDDLAGKEIVKRGSTTKEDFEKNRRLVEDMVRTESSSRAFYEIFGRRPGEYDFDDYKNMESELVRDENADLSTYRVRKKMLLDLKVFSKYEVDMLMDMKDRIELKGVSAHMARLRKPFKEFGAIFRFEGVLVDLTTIQNRAWERVAKDLNLRNPSDDNLRYASVQNPEYAARRIFYWTDDYQVSTQIGKLYNQYLKEEVESSFDGIHADSNQEFGKDTNYPSTLSLTDGVKSWISALSDVEMPVAVISYLDDATLSTLLNVTGLAGLFPKDRQVTKTNGLSRDSYLQLAACLHVDRRPDSCLLFEANIEGLKVARENDLRSVGLTTVYPMYELQIADTTVRDFNYMTAMNIRRLFGERKYHEPMTLPDSPMSKIQKRKVLTVYPGDEDGDWYGDDSCGIGGGKNNRKGGFKNDVQYDNDIIQDRYYGEDNYSPLAYNDIYEDGLMYDEEDENDLFQ